MVQTECTLKSHFPGTEENRTLTMQGFDGLPVSWIIFANYLTTAHDVKHSILYHPTLILRTREYYSV
jgi:hypothetical protein